MLKKSEAKELVRALESGETYVSDSDLRRGERL